MSPYRLLALAGVLVLSACQPFRECGDQNTLCFRDGPPSVTIVSPSVEDVIPPDADVVIEAFVLDVYDQPRTLYAHLFVGGDGDDYDPVVPDDLWKVRFDWHTPNTPGPVEIRVEATDLSGQSDARIQVFWIGEPTPE